MKRTKEGLPNEIPKTPLAKRVRNRLSSGMCRMDGKFYPSQYDLKLIAEVEALELQCDRCNIYGKVISRNLKSQEEWEKIHPPTEAG